MTKRRPQTLPEEIANSVCHAAAFLALVAAFPVLLATAVRGGRPHLPAAVSIFTATLALLFLSSAIYHALPRNGAKRLFQRVDQSAIFLSIAGTYTPFAAGSLRTAWDWTVFGSIWGLAVLGIAFRTFQGFRGTHLMTILYVALGGLALVALAPVLARMFRGQSRLPSRGPAKTTGHPVSGSRGRRAPAES